jgi:KEOPS complex subunit Cgi121
MAVVEGRASVENVDAFLDELAAIGEATGCVVQAFDARYVVDREHLARAVERADRSFERDENVARDRAVEILLYAAGRRQIDRALEMGVGEGTGPVAVVVHDPDGGGAGDGSGAGDGGGASDGGGDGVGDGNDDDESAAAERVADLLDTAGPPGEDHTAPELVRAFFDVSDAELEVTDGRLADVVHERVALLDVEK